MTDTAASTPPPHPHRGLVVALVLAALATAAAVALWRREPVATPAPPPPGLAAVPLTESRPLAMDRLPPLPAPRDDVPDELARGRLPSTVDGFEALAWAGRILA